MKYSCITILILSSFLYCGFNQVEDNNLNLIKYTFSDFKSEFETLDSFTCILEDTYWGIPYKTVLTLESKQSMSVFLRDENNTHSVIINSNNLDRFRKCFISDDSMEFIAGFPVKFFKVKTESETSEIEFSNIPGGSAIDSESKLSTLIYYAYSHYTDGGNKYVLLGTHVDYDPDVSKDLNTLVGWVLYEKKEEKQNVVLWNTNIGLRPSSSDQLDRQPFVFETSKRAYNNAVDYYSSEKKPKRKYLLVGKNGIEDYQSRFESENGGVDRWLPMYLVPKAPTYALRIGVVEKEAVVKRALDKFLLAESMQIVFVLDATASMTEVWKNLGSILYNVIGDFVDPTGGFTNIIGEHIIPKIKIYYYNNDHHAMMGKDNWISNIYDLQSYEHNINAVPIVASQGISPNIYGTLTNVIKDVGDDPSFIVVIGDASDSTYCSLNNKLKNIKQTPLLLDYIEGVKKYIHISAVRYDSNPEIRQVYAPEYDDLKKRYLRAYDEFAINFDVIEEINPQFDVNKASSNISKSIIDELNKVYESLVISIQDPESLDSLKSGVGAFTWDYLNTIRDLKLSEGKGTFFKEGYVNIHDKNGNPLYHKDVLVEQVKIRRLKEACKDYRNDRGKPELDRTLRRIVATFFEMDFQEVDDSFLETTSLEDFWTKIVGDKDVAIRIAPELYQANYSLAEVAERIGEFEQLFFDNSGAIIQQLTIHLDKEYGKYLIIQDIELLKIEKYYWVNVEDLNIFKGISL
jgi:hypothetical protein